MTPNHFEEKLVEILAQHAYDLKQGGDIHHEFAVAHIKQLIKDCLVLQLARHTSELEGRSGKSREAIFNQAIGRNNGIFEALEALGLSDE